MPNCQEQENFFSSEYNNNQDGQPINHNCINSQSAWHTPLTTTGEKNQNMGFGRENDMRSYDTGTNDHKTRTSDYSTGTGNYDPRTSAYRAGTREYDHDQYNSPGMQHFQNGAKNSVSTNEPVENVKIVSQIATQESTTQENSTNKVLGAIVRIIEDLQQNQQRTDSKLENFRGLNKTQGFRLSYEGGQIPQKNGEHVQTNSDMGHSKSRASLGMHDIACECSECLLEKIAKIAQAKTMENFQVDASKNNRPNTNCYESLQRVDSSGPIAVVKSIDESMLEAIGSLHKEMSKIEQEVDKVVTNVRELSDVVDHNIRKRDLESKRINQKLLESEKITDKFQQETNSGVMQQMHSVSVGMHEPLSQRMAYAIPNEQPTGVQPMRDRELLLNLTAQLNRQYSENMRKRVLQKAIDNPEEHYSKKAAHKLTDYSHYNKPNTECYGIGIPRGFFDEHHQSSNESDASLINPDNNNRPNTSCYGMTHEVDSNEPTAAIKSVEGSELTEIGQL
ncbi:MAG: hypothetical protein GY821_15970, partial [Gammaproteobacteria bacterium]|nr:hypothetical protein [Gammaproteobacteria bacterium]